jgi:hypothetical protein
LEQNGYFGEDADKICHDAHQGMLEKTQHNTHMTTCPAAGCAFDTKKLKKADMVVRHIKQVLAWKDVV